MSERGPGRPRSETSRRAVLEATRDLVAEVGYDSVTIDAIASRAGVGRQTIYRWWGAKAPIVAEAARAGLFVLAPPEPLTGVDAVQAVRSWFGGVSRTIAVPENAALMRGLAAAAASDPIESRALSEGSTRATHEVLVALLRAALPPAEETEHLDVVADALIGALLYRVLTRDEITDGFVEHLLRIAGLPSDVVIDEPTGQ
ncbi:TetR/AcrR family transcriptional regulator [Curtobacterium pusillum]|uniref:TetR/AcrR family transcriptional regulator n=1 Tax=Curtobacterium pusillum TaxID=69373 RepID=UPI003804D55A